MTSTNTTLAAPVKNRTGLLNNPELSKELIEGANQSMPSSEGSSTDVGAYRLQWAQDGAPIGSLPAQELALQAGAGAAQAPSTLSADKLAVLLDKLGERLHFERNGVRLYEALIAKRQQYSEQDPVVARLPLPSLADLMRIRSDELSHFALIHTLIVRLGGDPTTLTPSADVAAVLSLGVPQILTDPRSTMAHCLQAVQSAELQDNEGWLLLIQLTQAVGLQDVVPQLQSALRNEQEHLVTVRTWLSALLLAEPARAQ